MTADNIIKRIKIIIMKNIIDFLNQLLKETITIYNYFIGQN